MLNILRDEKFMLAASFIGVLTFMFESSLLHGSQFMAGLMALVLIVAILLIALRVAHHAEVLAEKVGEPYGTMILTLSAVSVEVVILAIMMMHNPDPTLMRDTIYSAVMIDLCGIIGLAALLGGFKHGEQAYNIDTGNTYIVMILTALGVAMIVPEFVEVKHWKAYSVFSIIVMILMYALFLRLQTKKHSYFFSYSYAEHGEESHDHGGNAKLSIISLLVGVILIGWLSEMMAAFLDVGLKGTGMPKIFPAIVVAAISASPEIMTAMRAALSNRMQPVMNIALGATLSTVVLTVPVVEAIGLFTGNPIELGLTPSQTALTLIALFTASINLHDGETNAIEGLTHLVLFATFIMLAALAG